MTYKIKKYIILSIILLVSINSKGQVNEEWIARYNSPFDRNDEGRVVRVDNSGNVFVCGNSSVSSTNTVLLTVKYDSLGNILWIKSYDYAGSNYVSTMEADKNGNVYVAGSSMGIGTSSDICVIKYNPNGDSVWVRRFNGIGNSNDATNELKIDNSGNVIVSGYSYNNNQMDFLTLKYDSSGVLLWNKIYNSASNDYDNALSLSFDNENNIYVAGISYGTGSGQDFCTIKYNSSGIEQWVAIYNGPSNLDDRFYCLAVDNSGNVLVSGSTIDTLQNYKYCTIKYNSSGSQLWLKKYDRGYALNFVSSIQTDSLNNIYITGSTETIFSKMDISTIKYTPNGDSLWVRTFNQSSNISPNTYSMILDKSGNIYITGNTSSNGSNSDYITIRYNTNGDFQWYRTYDGTGNRDDMSYSICLDKNNSVYVTGYSVNNLNTNGWPIDFLTIKYLQTNPSINVNLKILFEGLYYPAFNQLIRKDSIRVYLHQSTPPYSITDSAKGRIDSITFRGTFKFCNAQSGNYYLSAKHFNCIETWSKNGGEYLSNGYSIYNYDFTTSNSQSLGNNMKRKGTKYCLFSGNVNDDFIIDASDISSVENDVSGGVEGFVRTDLNGDYFVDSDDLSIIENNIGVLVVTP